MDRSDPGQDADLRCLSGAARVADRDLAADPELGALLDELREGIMAAERPRRRLATRFRAPRRPALRGLVPALAAALATALVLGGGLALKQFRADHGRPATTSSTAVPTLPPSPAASETPLPGAVTAKPGVRGRKSFPTGVYGIDPDRFGGGPGESGDRSEWYRLDALQPAGYLKILESRPLPPGSSWEPLRKQILLPGKRMQVTFLRLNFVRYATCEWAATWRDARAAGDTAIAAKAWKVLSRSQSQRLSGPDGRGGQYDVSYPIILTGSKGLEVSRYLDASCGANWRLVGALR